MHPGEPWSVSMLLSIDTLLVEFRECNLQWPLLVALRQCNLQWPLLVAVGECNLKWPLLVAFSKCGLQWPQLQHKLLLVLQGVL